MQSVISAAINAQLIQFEAAADPYFSTVARTPWATMTGHVSGPSSWVDAFSSALESVVRTVKPLVEQKRYVRNLLDKASK
jgi:vacuolar protein sorting-associated protein 53